MDYIQVTVLSDDGLHSVRTILNLDDIRGISEVHETMVAELEAAPGAKSIIFFKNGTAEPISVSESYDEIYDQL